MEKIKILIDTDLGDDTDDTAALMLALSCPELEIVGITTVFKDTKKRAEMVLDLLRFYGKEDIPVSVGKQGALNQVEEENAEEPIQYELLRPGEGTIRREAENAAAEFIVKMAKEHPGLVILGMGPMTNLALAFLKDVRTMKKTKIIAMGGAFLSSRPEWNIICDPEAAAVVVNHSENLTMMGLDVTRYLKVGQERLEKWKKKQIPQMDYFLRGVEIFCRATGFPVTFHDVLLVVYLLHPEVVTLKKGNFTVELSGQMTRGTMVDRSDYYEIDPEIDGNFQYAVSVDTDLFFETVDRYF
ncbi:MAG: nucleoside hydrolase [Lachnospiraceae bacterium]|nr:nucleoside hydrolase [Lachnospiraceae bacterium]